MLGDISGEQLRSIVHDCVGASPVPCAYDLAVRERAARVGRGQGLFDRVRAGLRDDEPIATIPYNLFRRFGRTGNRADCDAFMQRRGRQIDLAALAAYLGMNEKARYLQDLLWAECESTWWEMTSHEYAGAPIDLRAAMNGFHYALIATMFSNKLGGEVTDRVLAEVRTRILEKYLDPDRHYWWHRHTNNWNAVCNGAIGLAAMIVEQDPDRLTAILRKVLEGLPAFLSGFTDDGGCTEGPSYWRFGFGWYVRFAAGLREFTGGQVDIMAGQRIERMCRYPLAMWIGPGQDLNFADAHSGYLPAAGALEINSFHDIPELFGLCERTDDGQLRVAGLIDAMLYDGRTVEPLADSRDYCLADLGVAKLRSGAVTLWAKAGNNDEHHNHNDVGGIVVHRGRTYFLTDLGAPIYSNRTFGPNRYDSIFCNSLGHSVPVINGRGQPAGSGFAGSLRADGLNAGGVRTIVIEMADAYDDPALRRLTRTVEIDADAEEVRLADAFAFDAPPEAIADVFVTTLEARAAGDGLSVTIPSASDGTARREAVATAGRFEVTELATESAESRQGDLIRRISFTPAELSADMTLRFALRFE